MTRAIPADYDLVAQLSEHLIYGMHHSTDAGRDKLAGLIAVYRVRQASVAAQNLLGYEKHEFEFVD